MKALPVFVIGLSLSCPAIAQVTLASGSTFSHGFTNLQFFTLPEFSIHPQVRVSFYIDTNSAGAGTMLFYEFFETGLSGTPFRGGSFSPPPPGPNSCCSIHTVVVEELGEQHWADLEGGFRVTALSGSARLTRVRIDVIKSRMYPDPLTEWYSGAVEPPAVDPAPARLGVRMYPGLEIQGTTGGVYRIEYAATPNPTNWVAATNLVLQTSPQMWFDLTATNGPGRLYRAIGSP